MEYSLFSGDLEVVVQIIVGQVFRTQASLFIFFWSLIFQGLPKRNQLKHLDAKNPSCPFYYLEETFMYFFWLCEKAHKT